MELHAIILRVAFAWLFLTLLLRLSGKQTVSQLSGRTLVVTLVLSDLIDDMAWAEVPAASFIVAAGTVVLVHAIVALAATMSDRIHAVVEGDAPILMTRGQPSKRGMRGQRVNIKELAELLRVKGVEREKWPEIDDSRIEHKGRVSAVRRAWARPVQRRDVKPGT